ncbi:chromosome segregation protein SMC [Pacificitalea manganoxidans]|uniref:Chromosome partition protein Smc n=1 Tax=Pacificitalea manganoxidans TaxID=1411902 RepID=A0A291LVX7_9RHOB|nr:chromosome segregation protein SMC [Pacificitalea manganoxidans]ATI40794.1 chromosome segregation protein SMC [Pacificitalea manganoxidans]MDR6309802.1 chromosome segregation protein [Pacificitalea manganoxidans]
MRFTRLRLNGFKSFVDPTDLVIADGLTGVVGPNGCGKSNLLEALRWVMGENRPSAMRGGGMEDVIFAGASSRGARNFAEVGLIIDNAERLAPAGFNDADQLEVIRRITRDAGSAYKANTRDVRARDVQMLFADASTGAHSPALVRQGQISELINAKPKARRRILEEAAGISGLYQRRHEAELKLNAAETNLARVDDVIEQLASQLASLARQARQAARYREIGAVLRQAEGMLFYGRWHEADTLRAAVHAELRARSAATSSAEAAQKAAAERREAADVALPPLREEAAIAAALLQRLEAEQTQLADEDRRAAEAIGTLDRQIGQMRQDIAREEGLNRDAGETVARLDAETERLRQAEDGHDDRLAAVVEDARAAAVTLETQENALSQQTEDVARLAARHQSTHRYRDDAQKTLTRHETEAATARTSVTGAQEAVTRAEAQVAAATERQHAATAAAEAAETALVQADAARAECATREADARAARSAAEGEAGAIRAEVAALSRLVARDQDGAGQVLDLLRVDAGYEKALGAALADDLRAPAVTADAASGWTALPLYAAPQGLPEGAVPLTGHMQVPDVLARRMAEVGLVDAADGPRLQPALKPGQRLVSIEGDLWRWDGYRAGAEDAPTAAALRLQQLNRLAELQRDLDTIEARAAAARDTHETLTRQLADLTAADKAARQARRDADAAVTEASRAQSRAESDRSLAGTRMDAAELAVARHDEEAAGARARLQEAQAQVDDLPDLAHARAGVDAARAEVEEARRAMMAARAAQDELRRAGEGRARRAQAITREIADWRERLRNAESRKAELVARLGASEAELAAARARPAELAGRRETLAADLATAQTRRAAATEALSGAEAAFRAAEQAERDATTAASEAREARAAAQARAEAADAAVAAAAQRIEEERDCTPAELLATLDTAVDAMPAPDRSEAEVQRLRRQRDGLGAVNLRAEEDRREVAGEHDLLVQEKADLEEAIRALRTGIAGLNKEGRERLLTAFEQVNTNFAMLFTHLFGGGQARLELVESDDPLEAGLEIMCMPPGKKLSTLSLLSGGEQTLTALALIFAVFLANPAPICVLDEVDAPLDDANVTRFCDLLDEMCRRTDTRFLIITHHAITMSRMDRLFGVTMQEQGVSQLVSVDLKKAEQMVA